MSRVIPPSSSPKTLTRPARSFRHVGRLLEARFGGVLLLGGLALGIFFSTRVGLLLFSTSAQSWTPALLAAFGWGFLYDIGATAWILLPAVLLLAVLPRRLFQTLAGRGVVQAALLAVIGGLVFTAVAEFIFWEEFGARFNFIAVDYLVYTTEVIGNIRESYPLPLILGGVVALAIGLHVLLARLGWIARWLDSADEPWRERLRPTAVWLVVLLVLGLGLSERDLPEFANTYTRELAKNGPWSFLAAFRASELDYAQFYPTLSDAEAFAALPSLLGPRVLASVDPAKRDLLHAVPARGPARRLNVIQITVESLSASFLARYGNSKGLTPRLDALMPRALVFDQLFATGNRTDRGMEALTLSIPPTPGRSLVKRPDNAGLFTLGSVLRRAGYATAFIYGGFGYFDNMNAFFGGNGYRIVDRTAVGEGDITFANAWGACDEDLLRWTLREADRDHAAGQPFFHFVMTTSNHRPFTFPDGRIDLPSKSSGRAGGVKYTDHAIGAFLDEAAKHPWFNDTVFVIVADHCAASAGRASLPVENYHIPLIIYAPGGQLPTGQVETLMSQIDYAPTLLGLLNLDYQSRFFGRDVLEPTNASLPGRALVANYQKLGLYTGDRLSVLQPLRAHALYAYNPVTRDSKPVTEAPDMLRDTITYYQTAGWLIRHGRQNQLPDAHPQVH
jgi:phosphoglycerol transferase MdoB-like AlkP superfamily enzyme